MAFAIGLCSTFGLVLAITARPSISGAVRPHSLRRGDTYEQRCEARSSTASSWSAP
jgi:hypothetical protein